MKELVSRSLFTYWNGLRGDRIAPRRFEIEPSSIATYLPDTFILERTDPKAVRFRLAGTRISEAFGIDFRGLNLFDLFGDREREILEGCIAHIVSQGAVGVFQIEGANEHGFAASFELLILPLTHTRGNIDRFVGSIAPLTKPTWLGSVALTQRRLLQHELVWPDNRPSAAAQTMHHQLPFVPHLREAKIVRTHRRQFRVYEGGLNAPKR